MVHCPGTRVNVRYGSISDGWPRVYRRPALTGQELTVKIQNWLPKSWRSGFILHGLCL